MNELAIIDGSAAVTQAAAAELGFPELVRRFLDSIDRRESTKSTYARALKQFGNWIDENPTSGPMKSANILNYKKALSARNPKLSPLTINSYLAAVKKLFTWTESSGIYPNIAKSIESEERDRDTFHKDNLTLNQARELLASFKTQTASGKRDFAIVNLMIRTGLRTIEVIRANIEDIQNKGDATLLYVQGKGKSKKSRYAVLTPATLAPINSYLKTRGAVDPGAPLFAAISNHNRGGRLTTRSVSRLTKSAIEKIAPGRDRLTAHSLRHSAVTFALLAGATIQEAKEFARHSDINTTLIYAHNIERIANAPEIKIDAILNV